MSDDEVRFAGMTLAEVEQRWYANSMFTKRIAAERDELADALKAVLGHLRRTLGSSNELLAVEAALRKVLGEDERKQLKL